MKIRTYQPGDEAAQAEVYNEAAAGLPKFKPATAEEVARRCRAPDFDPATRFYAEEDGRVVGYATLQPNGRVSYPWCRQGHEAAAEPLFRHVWQELTRRNVPKAFAAYRADWTTQLAFWKHQGFHQAREMVNYVMYLSDMPTRRELTHDLSPLRREDVPAIFGLVPGVLGVDSPAALERYLFHNPYFAADSVFVNRKDGQVASVGLLIRNPSYAAPRQIDAGMPCFRLGAFGTEGMTTKRVNGLFSFLAPNNSDLLSQAHMLLEYAAQQLERADQDTLAAQVPSDVPHLVRFYKSIFQRQGGFPVFEKPVRTG